MIRYLFPVSPRKILDAAAGLSDGGQDTWKAGDNLEGVPPPRGDSKIIGQEAATRCVPLISLCESFDALVDLDNIGRDAYKAGDSLKDLTPTEGHYGIPGVSSRYESY